MRGLVVPFRGQNGKTRLVLGSDEARTALALAMLEDVVSACAVVGRTIVVTSDRAAAALSPEVVLDPGGGLGAAVAAGLDRLEEGPALVVCADLPCATPGDLLALLEATPTGGIALVSGTDGTSTNALGLGTPDLFAPLYGPGSAERFRTHARALGVPFIRADIPNLTLDVDTAADAAAVNGRAGPRTQGVLAALVAGVVR